MNFSSSRIKVANRKALVGLLQYRRCWMPSLRGWLVLLFCIGGSAVAVVFGLYPFLSLNRQVKADVLVVEGWVNDFVLEYAAREFESGHYTRIFATGGPLSKGSYLIEHKSFAGLGAATLRARGLASNVVVAVPASETRMDRTYQSALALREWLQKTGQPVEAMNVVTIGAHARRSRLIYQRVFGGRIAIGVISVPSADFEPTCWWRYSAGLRDVVGEALAYGYARLFSPS